MEERWLPVPGYEDLYEVSDHGRVRGVDRILNDGRVWKGRILKQTLAGRTPGHFSCMLSREGTQERRYVHQLVVFAFIGLRPDGMEVCHYDDDNRNNRLDNLYYGTRIQNEQDKIRNGRSSWGTRNPMAILDEKKAIEIARLFRQENKSCAEIGAIMGVNVSTVRDIVRGKNWSFATGIKDWSRVPVHKQHRLRGGAHRRARLTECDVMEMWQLKDFVEMKEIARIYGVTRSMVYLIFTGRTWRHIGPFARREA